jgi:protein kinase-like protein/PilZ domain-containing protein
MMPEDTPRPPMRSEQRLDGLPKPPPLPKRATIPDPSEVAPSSNANAVNANGVSSKPTLPRGRLPKVLVLNAPDRFLAQVKTAAASLAAIVVAGDLSNAGDLVKEHRPCAVVVTDDTYAGDRSGLNRFALDADALLVVWSDDAEGRQLEPLLSGAITRWGRSAYEKGAVVDGRWELLRDLGGRCPGSRWDVRHARTGRRSMLKVGVRSPGDDSDAEGVQRETLALARVQHPGAVDVRDAGSTEIGDPYVVVERIEGRSLEGILVARGALAAEEACAIVRQVAEVVAAAHEAGVTHGAVKPENILLTRDGYGTERARLVQWEAAALAKGTVDPTQDVSGLIACAFEALVGRAKNRDEDPRDAPLGDILAADYASAKDFIATIDAAVPRARDGSSLLDARVEKRAGPSNPPPDPSVQRRHPRVAYRTPVRIEVPGIGAIDGRSEDVSIRGLLCMTRESIEVGTLVMVRFALPIDGNVVSETGIVKWSRAAKSGEAESLAIGIELTTPGEESLRQIVHFVAMTSDASAKT